APVEPDLLRLRVLRPSELLGAGDEAVAVALGVRGDEDRGGDLLALRRGPRRLVAACVGGPGLGDAGGFGEVGDGDRLVIAAAVIDAELVADVAVGAAARPTLHECASVVAVADGDGVARPADGAGESKRVRVVPVEVGRKVYEQLLVDR